MNIFYIWVCFQNIFTFNGAQNLNRTHFWRKKTVATIRNYYTEKELSLASLPKAKLKSEFLLFKFKLLILCRCKGSAFLQKLVKTFLGFEEELVWGWPISPEKLTGAKAPARDRRVEDGIILSRQKKRYLRNRKIAKWERIAMVNSILKLDFIIFIFSSFV